MKKRFKSLIIFLILAAGLFAALLLSNKIQYGERSSIVNSNDYYSNLERWNIHSLNDFRQSFRYDGDSLHSFSLKYAVFEGKPEAEWTVQLYDKAADRKLGEWTESIQTIESEVRKEYVIDSQKLRDSSGEYEIRVVSDYVGLSGVTLCASDTDTLKTGEFTMNGEKMEGDISIEYTEMVNVRVTLVYGAAFCALAAALITWFFWNRGWRTCLSLVVCGAGKLKKQGKKLLIYGAAAVLTALAAGGLEWTFAYYNLLSQDTQVSFNIYRFVFFTAAGWSVLLLFGQRRYLKRKPEIVAASLFLLIGFTYVFAIPSLQEVSWDESIHLWRAVGLSHATTGMANEAESYVYWRSGIPFSLPSTISYYKEQLNNIQKIYDMGRVTGANVDVLSGLYMAAYIPAAMLLKLGRGLHLPFWITFKLGAAANLIFYVTVIYFAMKKLRSGKMILACAASVGTAFFLANVYSSDGWIISLSILGFAYFVGCMQKKGKVTNRELIVMAGAFTLAYFPKTIYFPMLLLLLFLPRDKFQNSRQYRWFLSSVFAGVGLLAIEIAFNSIWIIPVWFVFFAICNLIGKLFERIGDKKRDIVIAVSVLTVAAVCIAAASVVLPRIVGSGDIRGGYGVNAGEQLRGILQNPVGYAAMMFSYLKDALFSFDLSLKLIFVNLGYLGSSPYHIEGLILLIAVCLTDKNSCDRWKRSGFMRAAAVILSLGCIVMIASAMYISFTPVGYSVVLGCQQRYLLPLLYPVAALIGSCYIENRMNRTWYNGAVTACIAFLLMANIWVLAVSRYS
jgi:uncharacterized membrane protein